MKEGFVINLLLSISLIIPSPVFPTLKIEKVSQKSSSTLLATARTFIVSNTSDSGTGSLRQAILDANAHPGTDVISFCIGSGVQTISPLSALPTITDPVIIDGTSQSGFSGAPIIELKGSNAGAGADGLDITGGSSTVRGLVINNFGGAEIRLATKGNNIIIGNYIGTDVTGTLALGRSSTGLLVYNTPNNMIGGEIPGAGNLISGNAMGVDIFGSAATGNSVRGNYIGTDVGGTAALENSNGVRVVLGSNNSIGGTMVGAGNVISGNRVGVFLFVGATENQVVGNLIGPSANGNGALGNFIGVRIISADNNSIGGTSSGAGNRIAYNRILGVSVRCGASCSVYNSILSNSIFSNIGLGIDLGEDGVTLNIPCGSNFGPNKLQNYPTLTSAISNGFGATIEGTLNSAPDTTFLIQFFANSVCDPSGFGEGETFVGSSSVTTNGNCDATFSVILPAAIHPGQVITATATDSSGNTSEFSQCIPVIGVAQFDVCLQDDSNGNILRINSTTGDYQFTNCAGVTFTGTGALIKRGSSISLQHYAADRRVLAKIDTSVNKATASIQLLSPSTTFTITDRNIVDNTCACAPN